MKQRGFTLIETLTVMAIFILFAAMLSINLINIEPRSSIILNTSTIISDIKNQQLKAMTGAAYNNATSNFGIYFQSDKYTLFAGDSYQQGHLSNAVITLPQNTILSSSTFPDGPNTATIVFNKNTGEINNFAEGSNTLIFKNTVSDETKIVTLNKLGVITGLQ